MYLRNFSFDGLAIFRFVWKGIYEKLDALLEIEVCEKNAYWYIIMSLFH
mgnify:CR=1 FL=1